MNKVVFAQIWGMTRYEFRMHWRRRGLIILMWGILVVVGISILLISSDSFQQLKSLAVEPATMRELVTGSLVLLIFPSIGIGLISFLPIVAAETIPLDRQYGVRDLLDALPLSPNAYLMGKLLGLWTAVLSAMGLIMLAIGVLWWLKVGAFNIGYYAEVWLIGIGSIVVLNGSLGVLIPAAQSSRRQAIVVTIIGILVLGWLLGGMTDTVDLRGMLSIFRGPILNYFLFAKAQEFDSAPFGVVVPTFPTVLLTIGLGLMETAVLFVLVRLWTGWLNTRR